MRFNNKKTEWKRREIMVEEQFEGHPNFKKRKKERREKYKVKNQKLHQMGYEGEEDEELLL